MFKALSVQVILALTAGLCAGALASPLEGGPYGEALASLESVGTLWLNALRMTVIPLVFSLLVTGIASVTDAASTGRLAVRSLLVFAVMLVSATLYAVIVLPGVLSIWPVDMEAAETFIAGSGASAIEAVEPPHFGEWIAGLAPSNPVAAAAEGAILPLVVFAIFFGFASTRLPAAQREPFVSFFRSLSDTMIIIVQWVLIVAPIGVFALSLGVGLRSGLGVAGLLVQYLVIACVVTAGVSVLACLFAAVWGRMSLARFLGAAAPVLAVAFSTQSSLASLPLMVERSRDGMGVSHRVVNLTLPLAVAVFRMTSPVTNLAVVYFMAAVFGLEFTTQQIIAGALVAIAVSIGSVGLPGQISFIASVAPISIAMGVPLELLGILLAVEVIPDIFRTVGNVTGDMAATAVVDRGVERRREEGDPG
jgi:Na+/H+-dicarboxylate symporter